MHNFHTTTIIKYLWKNWSKSFTETWKKVISTSWWCRRKKNWKSKYLKKPIKKFPKNIVSDENTIFYVVLELVLLYASSFLPKPVLYHYETNTHHLELNSVNQMSSVDIIKYKIELLLIGGTWLTNLQKTAYKITLNPIQILNQTTTFNATTTQYLCNHNILWVFSLPVQFNAWMGPAP